jgi:hypothetical protein
MQIGELTVLLNKHALNPTVTARVFWYYLRHFSNAEDVLSVYTRLKALRRHMRTSARLSVHTRRNYTLALQKVFATVPEVAQRFSKDEQSGITARLGRMAVRMIRASNRKQKAAARDATVANPLPAVLSRPPAPMLPPAPAVPPELPALKVELTGLVQRIEAVLKFL